LGRQSQSSVRYIADLRLAWPKILSLVAVEELEFLLLCKVYLPLVTASFIHLIYVIHSLYYADGDTNDDNEETESPLFSCRHNGRRPVARMSSTLTRSQST
jgi:hypothetical protein